MTFRTLLIPIAAALVLGANSPALLAADTAKHPCANVRDNADRLACYDQAFGKPAETAAAPAPQAQFGYTEQEARRQAGHTAEDDGTKSISATVTALERSRDGKFVVTLDNAQSWSQSEYNSQADVSVGDTVTVGRGALGSYLLVTKAGIGTRVRRVK
jgi:hypothetical protein